MTISKLEMQRFYDYSNVKKKLLKCYNVYFTTKIKGNNVIIEIDITKAFDTIY